MPDYRTMYDRDYIGHFDLPGGKDLTLTIKRVVGGELTAMGGRKSKKPIVHFKEEGIKPLICNKTNSKTVAAMYSNMTEQWAGKRITLFVSTTRNPDGSGEVECIRVRPKVPNAAAQSRASSEHEQSLDDGIDADAAAPSNAATPASPSATSPAAPESAATIHVTEAQEGEILDLLEANGISIKTFLQFGKLKRIADLPAERLQGAKEWINKNAVKP